MHHSNQWFSLQREPKEQEGERPSAGLPNPASVYCEKLGYKLEIRTDETGGQYGVCIFPDGQECEEWKFFRGKCGQKFSFCEKQGYKIENKIEDMGTWTAEYAVCIFPDGSECKESAFFEGRCVEYGKEARDKKEGIETTKCGWCGAVCTEYPLKEGVRCPEVAPAPGYQCVEEN